MRNRWSGEAVKGFPLRNPSAGRFGTPPRHSPPSIPRRPITLDAPRPAPPLPPRLHQRFGHYERYPRGHRSRSPKGSDRWSSTATRGGGVANFNFLTLLLLFISIIITVIILFDLFDLKEGSISLLFVVYLAISVGILLFGLDHSWALMIAGVIGIISLFLTLLMTRRNERGIMSVISTIVISILVLLQKQF